MNFFFQLGFFNADFPGKAQFPYLTVQPIKTLRHDLGPQVFIKTFGTQQLTESEQILKLYFESDKQKCLRHDLKNRVEFGKSPGKPSARKINQPIINQSIDNSFILRIHTQAYNIHSHRSLHFNTTEIKLTNKYINTARYDKALLN